MASFFYIVFGLAIVVNIKSDKKSSSWYWPINSKQRNCGRIKTSKV